MLPTGTDMAPPPDRAAIVSQTGTVTFGEMGRYVRQLTGWIAAQGIGPGQAVGFSIADEPLHLLTSLALLRMGCPQISLATHDPAPLRQDLIRRCGVVAVIGETPRDDGVRHIPISRALPLGEAADGAADLPAPQDDAIALYLATSGTTGASKIIACTHWQLAQQGATRHMPPAARSEYIPSSIQFLYPKKHRLRSAMNGYTGVFHLAGPAEIPGICRAHGVDVLRLSPPQARSLIDLAAVRPECRLPEALSGDQYALVLRGADHQTFGGQRADQLLANRREQLCHQFIRCASLAFWDAYLKDNHQARDWLRHRLGPELGRDGTVRFR
jgi:acyl-coenzyme A synthetase/AMP-(fatty) acid ligase